jgi:3-oxoacyl-[acyl-carrier protein] reductase
MIASTDRKTALVTGASRGIGRAIAERLAADGATVIVNYARDRQAAEAVVNGIAARGARSLAIQADVAKPAEVRRLFEEAEAAAGPLDIVVANAAVFFTKPLAESTEEDYERIFTINTRGAFFTLQEAARRVRDGGRIIAVSTCGTRLYFPHASLYLGSKGAVEQFVRTLSRELGPRRITVNALAPGFTDTDMLHDDEARALGVALSPFQRLGTPQDVADVAGFLASEAARWITGQNVDAGGGVV